MTGHRSQSSSQVDQFDQVGPPGRMPCRPGLSLLAAILLALAVRIPVAAWRFESLQDDRDHYRLLADGVARGQGLEHPDHGTPTAYRPPLYPLLLAAVARFASGDLPVATLHLLLGLATVAGTWVLANRLELGRHAFWPAAAVAVDPLLVVGATLPMTETLFTTLTVWMLVAASTPHTPHATRRHLALGILFGLATLCRPSVWAFALLCGLATVASRWRRRNRPNVPVHLKALTVTTVGVALCVGPWLARNLAVSDTPVLTTTHGGYTLLLGNNPVFYDQVVRQPLGTTWNDIDSEAGSRPDQWRTKLESRLPVPPHGIHAEAQRDAFMYRQARSNIADDPTGFAQACLLRVLRFWTPWPLESAPGSAWPRPLKWIVALWYSATLGAGLVGLCRAPWRTQSAWISPLLFLLALSLLHVVFWSTMRMRAPVMPVVFLLATVGIGARTDREAVAETAAPEAY